MLRLLDGLLKRASHGADPISREQRSDWETGAAFSNCTITGNTADRWGGGLYCKNDGEPVLTNCTVSGNTAADAGGDAYVFYSNPQLVNTVIWSDDEASTYFELATPVVSHADIRGATGQPWCGEGCLDADPLFADPDGPDDDPDTWEDNDYRLARGSPCIDAGDNGAVPPDIFDIDNDGDTSKPIPFDLQGEPRSLDYPASADAACDAPGSGDFDGGGLSTTDIVLMTDALLEPVPTEEIICTGDMNDDGQLNGADIQVFVEALLGS